MRSSPGESLHVMLLLEISFRASALHMVWLSIGRRFEALSNSFFHISHEEAFVVQGLWQCQDKKDKKDKKKQDKRGSQ